MHGSQALERSRIADINLAAEGERQISWVDQHCRVLKLLAQLRLSDGALKGCRVAVVTHLEAKAAYLATLLAGAGAKVVAGGCNPGTTDDAVCAALVRRGIEVHAVRGASRPDFETDLMTVADIAPEFIVDDGAELTSRILDRRPGLARQLRGVSEETTTGVIRLRALEKAGLMTFPAIAANNARSKQLFDNRYGTGQSALSAILSLTNLSGAGKEYCIVGYGWVGKGLAKYAEGLGGRVTVVEVDPIAAMEAFMDGHRVARLAEALPTADIAITATGGIEAIGRDHIQYLRNGVILANAGHDDREIEVPALVEAAVEQEEARPGVTRYSLEDGRDVYVLVHGKLVNVAGAQGHPIEIMDLSFSVQALAVHHLASHKLSAGVHLLPGELDREIARTKLATLGIQLDELTPSQRALYEQWKV